MTKLITLITLDSFCDNSNLLISYTEASPEVTTFCSSQYVLAILSTSPGLLELSKDDLSIFQMNYHEIVKWTADFRQSQSHTHILDFSCLFVQ